MSVECLKKLSMVTAGAFAVLFLTLMQPIADGEIDGLFAGLPSQGADMPATDTVLPSSRQN